MKWEFKGFYSKALESLRLPNNVQIISSAMSYKCCVTVGLLLEETNTYCQKEAAALSLLCPALYKCVMCLGEGTGCLKHEI